MSRKDLGSLLGLSFETVSRLLSLFRERGWIAVAGRKVRILERCALQSQATGA